MQVDILSLINDEFGTEYELEDGWEQILDSSTLPPGEAAGGGTGATGEETANLLVRGADLPSEDDEDSDFEG